MKKIELILNLLGELEEELNQPFPDPIRIMELAADAILLLDDVGMMAVMVSLTIPESCQDPMCIVHGAPLRN